MAFGQEVAVTPIQILNAFAAVANGGIMMMPRLVRGVADPVDGRRGALGAGGRAPRGVRRDRATLREMCLRVVEEGTGSGGASSSSCAWPEKPAPRRRRGIADTSPPLHVEFRRLRALRESEDRGHRHDRRAQVGRALRRGLRGAGVRAHLSRAGHVDALGSTTCCRWRRCASPTLGGRGARRHPISCAWIAKRPSPRPASWARTCCSRAKRGAWWRKCRRRDRPWIATAWCACSSPTSAPIPHRSGEQSPRARDVPRRGAALQR